MIQKSVQEQESPYQENEYNAVDTICGKKEVFLGVILICPGVQ